MTVPVDSWITVSNGKLISVTDAGQQSENLDVARVATQFHLPHTAVAGEFDEAKQSLRNLPLTYYAPKGRGDASPQLRAHPPDDRALQQEIGVEDYPWEKYAQVMVDYFVAGGMENSSATTQHRRLAPYPETHS